MCVCFRLRIYVIFIRLFDCGLFPLNKNKIAIKHTQMANAVYLKVPVSSIASSNDSNTAAAPSNDSSSTYLVFERLFSLANDGMFF